MKSYPAKRQAIQSSRQSRLTHYEQKLQEAKDDGKLDAIPPLRFKVKRMKRLILRPPPKAR